MVVLCDFIILIPQIQWWNIVENIFLYEIPMFAKHIVSLIFIKYY